jgi:hypothetical protein
MAYEGITAPIVLGSLGLYTDNSPSDLPPSALIEAKNVTLERGMVQKAPGSLIYNTSDQLSGSVQAIHDWWPETHLQRMIALTDAGNIYRDIGDRTFTSATAIKTGMGAVTPNSMFVEGGHETALAPKKLFLFTDGLRQLQVLEGDGVTFTDVGSPAADWTTPNFPRVGVHHRARMWAFMKQRAYASSTGSHENFVSDNLTQSIYPGEGGDIIGAYVFKGRLFAFKEGNFVYFLDDSAADDANWFWKKLSNNFGLAAPNAVFDSLNDMIAGNSSGTATSYTATDALGDVESADLFRSANMEQYLRANLSTAGINVMHTIYYEAKKQAFFTYRSTYKNNNDMVIVMDLNKENPRISFWVKGTPQCLAQRKDKDGIPRPMYGSSDGYVHFMDYEDRLEGAASYEGAFRTAYTDFRGVDPKLMTMQKHFDFLWLEFKEEGPHSVSVDVFIDGVFIETLTVPMNAEGTYLDSFLLDTDRLSESLTQSLPKPLHGTGRRISFRVYNSGSNESFQIASITVGFRPGDESATKF